VFLLFFLGQAMIPFFEIELLFLVLELSFEHSPSLHALDTIFEAVGNIHWGILSMGIRIIENPWLGIYVSFHLFQLFLGNFLRVEQKVLQIYFDHM